MSVKGVIAAGHPETAAAIAAILEEGGNAFDAALAGLCAACVAEPVLAGLGGGGFLLARAATGRLSGRPVLYDFFAHTPKIRRPEGEIDFYPIVADFGTQTQEFHAGLGAIATPGVLKGLFEVHRDLGSVPMRRIIEPAVRLAKEGVTLNKLQAHIFSVVGPIYLARPESRAIFCSPDDPKRLSREGEIIVMPDLADVLEVLAHEGEDLFYRGEIGRVLAGACRDAGGYLTMADLESYRVIKRRPLELTLADARIFINPPPTFGGILIAFAMELLKKSGFGGVGFGSPGHLEHLAAAMAATNRARVESRLHEAGEDAMADGFLHPDFVAAYRNGVLGRPASTRGTTQISVIDAEGNAASLTLSNGEGCGWIIPGTGIMPNNMLGEEDINPHGFHRWPSDVRLASMMAPTLMQQGRERLVALGSGGSNRIRTAILQVLSNVVEFGMPLPEAVEAPRIHVESDLVSIEPGFGEGSLAVLDAAYSRVRVWEERNLFFGGVHSVLYDDGTKAFEGAGDPRRGGVAVTV